MSTENRICDPLIEAAKRLTAHYDIKDMNYINSPYYDKNHINNDRIIIDEYALKNWAIKELLDT